jgi:hypothetical protein
MNDGFAWWLVVLGIAIGVGLTWLFMIRLPRVDADIDEVELAQEAHWISRTIHAYGGVAPEPLVEEVLELHHQYLATGAAPPTLPIEPAPGSVQTGPPSPDQPPPLTGRDPSSGTVSEDAVPDA